MVRVLWAVPPGHVWLGGTNYFRNLLEALLLLPDRMVQPVVLGDSQLFPEPLSACPCLGYTAFSGRSIRGILDGIERCVLKNGGRLARELQDQNIGLFSHTHSVTLGQNSPVPELCWICDFQHIHYPHFFSAKECATRSADFARIAKYSTCVLLSSENARTDFNRLYSRYAHKTRVLHFVAPPPTVENLASAGKVLTKHDIHAPYIHIPNQLWVHKNHMVAIEALRVIRDQGGNEACPLIISTGHTVDHRHPDFFNKLQEKVRAYGLAEHFRFLGVIPDWELAILMRCSMAMLNPSLFEGWSTTVEEAKSLGKRLILSNIAVHLEQAPARGLYFEAKDPEDLARKIRQAIEEYDHQKEADAEAKAESDLPLRMKTYALEYEELVREMANC